MLESLLNAISVKGRKNTEIARDMNKSKESVAGWLSGRNPIPARVRPAFETAVGCQVDWIAYQADFDAYQIAKGPMPERPTAPRPDPAPPQPPAPIRVGLPEARQRPATLQSDPWGATVATRTAPRAVAPPPAARRGLLASIFSDDGGEEL